MENQPKYDEKFVMGQFKTDIAKTMKTLKMTVKARKLYG